MLTVRYPNFLNYTPSELLFGTSGLRSLASEMTDLECYINTEGFINYLASIGEGPADKKMIIAGDFRSSTPRIEAAVAKAVAGNGYQVLNIGMVPTPAAALYALNQHLPLAMITGSHIPADRNGIKFYKPKGELLKTEEPSVKLHVKKVREAVYEKLGPDYIFNSNGSLKQPPSLPMVDNNARLKFIARYVNLFKNTPLVGKKVVVYQHSSVAADMLVELMEALGAKVVAVDKSSEFVPIDTENVTEENKAYFKQIAAEHPESLAIISADGDADRPFIVDEKGVFHRGDVVGAIVAQFLGARSAVVPVSTSDAVDSYLKQSGIKLVHTKIGSPHVIEAMEDLASKGRRAIVGWEVNGGFLTGSDIELNSTTLEALPTRDSFLPIVCVLVRAVRQSEAISEVFAGLPHRFTQAGLLNDFPVDISKKILDRFRLNSKANHQTLEDVFSRDKGFGQIVNIDSLDGVRISFSNGNIAHIRPSGNAPQLRIYSVANTQKRADEIVKLGLEEPGGLLRTLEKTV